MNSVIEFVEHNGLFVPKTAVSKRPIAIDLFCGAGGISLGFIQAGFEVVAGLDFDYYAMLTYLMNLGTFPVNIHFIDPEDKEKVEAKMQKDLEKQARKNGGIATMPVAGSGWIKHHPEYPGVSHFFYGDVRKTTGQQILDAIGLKPGEVDCVAGGPPCQGFSIAGKREVMDPRNSLVFDFARLILEIQPKTFMMENVPGLLSMVTPEGIPVIDALCLMLSEGGYGAYESLKKALLASAGCGAALKNTNEAKKQGKAKEESMREEEQLSLF